MKVSICIPSYRQVDFLRVTLRSIAAQDFLDYEVIVTDDSPDDSVEQLVKEFPLEGRLSYVRNATPLGSPENWNACIRLARGELVKILHHDDHFTTPQSLRKFVALLDDNPRADFAFAATRVEDVSSGIDRVHRPLPSQLEELRSRPVALFLGNFVGAPSATICRRTLHLDYDRRMKWLVDLDFYIRALKLNPEFAYSPEPLISTPTNAVHQVTEICRDDGNIELTEYLLLFDKLTPDERLDPNVDRAWLQLFNRFKVRKLQDFLRYGVPVPADTNYFEDILRRRVTLWMRLRRLRFSPVQIALKVFYRLYPHAPLVIRAPIKNIVARRRAARAGTASSPKPPSE